MCVMEDPFNLPPDVPRRIPLFAEIAKVLSWTGGPVNWDLARQVATSIAAASSEGAAGALATQEISEHVRIAELWLEELAGLRPSTPAAVRAATAGEWAEHAIPIFAELIDPVAAKAARALGTATAEDHENVMAQAIGQVAPMFMGMQAGTVLGQLAGGITGTYETEMPVSEHPLLLIVPAMDSIARDYGLDQRQVRQYAAVRAVAMRALIEEFPGARANFFALYHDFVSSLDVDVSDAMGRLAELDFSDPSRLQDMLQDQSFLNMQPSAQTSGAAARVSRFIALISAHVSLAVDRIGEAFARRGVESSAPVRALYPFIGLEPPAATVRRSAASFLNGIVEDEGLAILDRLWEDAETFPSDEELDDPNAWLRRTTR
jgi:putative hydrolase